MSDHRFSLKVEFSIYGEDYEWEASLNWNGWDALNNGDCDPRITEWFAGRYADARAKYDAETAAENERRARVLTEMKERAELRRLLAKYPGDAPASGPFREWFAPTELAVSDDFRSASEPPGL